MRLSFAREGLRPGTPQPASAKRSRSGDTLCAILLECVRERKSVSAEPEELACPRIAQEEQRSRSELLREAMRVYIEVRRSRTRPGDDPEVRAAIAIQDAISRKSPGTGQDSTADVRRWREVR